MFTGIIRSMGTMYAIDTESGDFSMTLDVSLSLKAGDSIAVNGVCLTVERFSPFSRGSERGFLSFTVMPATFRATALGALKPGDRVNCEEPLRAGEKLDGHIVLGHVDGVGEIIGIDPEQTSKLVTFRVPADLATYIASKGSVAVDGVSLTVVSVDGATFVVSLTPYTLQHTRFGALGIGAPVNIEVDVLARYVERFQQART